MILGVIPARAGSKGLPGKNIKPLAGKPLIAWSIEHARQAKKLDRFVVSTEDPKIAEISKSYGSEVQMRPEALATDYASTFDVLKHLLTSIPAKLIVLLQPTSPILKENLIDRCIEQFLSSRADSLATGWQCYYQPYATSNETNRQSRKSFFYDDGNLYIFKAKNILNGNPFGNRHELVYIDKEQNIDIDDEFDFWVAEQVLLKQKIKL